MREILFKAKRIDNGEWVEGFFVNAKEELGNENRTAEIITINAERVCKGEYSYTETFVVDLGTLCQYTGLFDKNGNKIWENDVALRTSSDRTFTGKIVYDRIGSLCHKDFETNFEALTIGSECNIEVIGNIFDNPYQYKKE